MTQLLLGLLLFLGIHSMRVFMPGLRMRLMTAWGTLPFKGVYSVISLVGLWVLIQGYAAAKTLPYELWSPPFFLRHLSVLLMWPATVLVIAAYVPGNGIRAKLRHPMTLGIKIWALAHLLCNGHIADVLLFGTLLIWAVLIYRNARREDRSNMVGVMRSTNPLVNLGTLIALLAGTGVWLWLALGGGHLALIGVSPMG
ncbi:MAG: NnrU family protein [Alphaproteobacteria bacterium]|nr:NnrU family protein [Alphaproteobacteria bacterium]